jgi:hypothetical protein
MKDQLPIFDRTNSEDTPSAISLPELESGPTLSGSPDGQTTAKSGPEAVPANPSARPAKAKRSTTKGIFGQTSFVSSKHEDLSFALASRLRPLTDSLGSTLFSLTWMTRATPAGRSISALRASEPLTEGSVFIGWPTPKHQNFKATGPSRVGDKIDLQTAAILAGWPTTRAIDGEKGQRTEAGLAAEILRKGHLDELPSVASLAGWPTPVANDDNKTPEAHQAMKQRMGERDGTGANRTAITSLQVMAQLAGWKSPKATDGMGRYSQVNGKRYWGFWMEAEACQWPVDPSMDSGEKLIGFLLGPNGWEIVPAYGQLNAAHSRWLMGLPPVWDDCGVTAMESLRKRRKRS